MTEHARIAPLPNLPLFHKLEGRKAVVVGSSDGATWKAELLEAAGANVVRLIEWSAADLQGAAVAVADLPDRDEAERFLAAARSAGAVANIIDQTDLCDVTFGTIVNRSPVVVAISTDGAAPVLGQSIRARIESVLPLGLSAWASAAKTWRGRLKGRVASFGAFRAFSRVSVRCLFRPALIRLIRSDVRGDGLTWSRIHGRFVCALRDLRRLHAFVLGPHV